MKPMLKATFFSLVNDLLARSIMPELIASTLTSYGSLKWKEGDCTRVEELYSVRDCSQLTASTFRKRFRKWFDEIIAAYHAAAAEKLAYGQKVIDGETVRTVTGFHTIAPRDSLGNKTNGVCSRTGVIVLDGKIEVMAGAVKAFTPPNEASDAMIANAHAEALEMDSKYEARTNDGDQVRLTYNLSDAISQRGMVSVDHTEALELNELVDAAVSCGTYSTNENLTPVGVNNASDRIRAALLELNCYPAHFILKMMMSVRRLTKLANEAAQEHYREMLARPAVDGIDSDIPF